MKVLAVDLGGTHARFAVANVPTEGAFGTDEPRVLATKGLDLTRALTTELAQQPDVEAVGLAVAGPVRAGRAVLTNAGLTIDGPALTHALGRPVVVLNDFEAVAWGTGRLEPQHLAPLRPRSGTSAVPVDPDGVRAVIGAGTGLGQAVALPTETGLRVVPGEGGHRDFAPRDAFEDRLLVRLRAEHPDHVSYERVISGMGLVAIHATVLEAAGATADFDLDDVDAASREIVRRATAGSDPHAVTTARRFASLYGADAGNLALTVVPRGGVYVAGGLVQRLTRFVADEFVRSFDAKGRMRPLLESLPIFAIVSGEVGLVGAAYAASTARS